MNDARLPPAVDQPWSRSAESVAQTLGCDLREGLNNAEARARHERLGPNTLRQQESRAWWQVIVGQLADWMIGLLAAAAVVSAVSGEWSDALLIFLIVAANAGIGFMQHRRAEEAIAALRKLSQPEARVWRSGRLQQMPATELVVGDLVALERGNLIPADGRWTVLSDLEADEAALTGESLPVAKHVEPLPVSAALPDRTNMGFAGTAITQGRGRLLVTAIGMQTEVGRIAQLLSEADAGASPLEARLRKLSKQLAVVVVALCGLTFLLGLWRLENASWQQMLLASVSLAVAAVPEGLPAVITIALALGSQRMAARRAIVRQLSAVETLGSVDVICSDKTGTLTQNRMSVAEAIVAGSGGAEELLAAAVLCNDAQLAPDGQMLGSATEVAITHYAIEHELDVLALRNEHARLAEIPFDSRRKWMATLHDTPLGPPLLLVKGAAEAVLGRCVWVAEGDSRAPLPSAQREEFDAQIAEQARRGRRLLAVGRRQLEEPPRELTEDDCQELEFLGIIGLVDPPRPEAATAIAACRAAGIAPVMITGDHPATALAIARDLGLASEETQLVTGPEIERMSEDELVHRCRETSVYARVSPEHKLRIVRAHQARGAVVAMTGDGVNDAPALRQAEIGVAMGITGTDVSKQAANMVLADDNFATIVAAVEQGRVVYDNIRKFVRYLLSSNASELLLILAALLLGLPLPLLAVHLLWINLVTDGLPALALGFEPPEPDVMCRRPRGREGTILDRRMLTDIALAGGWMGFVALALYLFMLGWPLEGWRATTHVAYARTASFVTLAVMQLAFVLAIRSERQSYFSLSLFGNYRLHGAVVVGIALQIALVYTPWLQRIFHTTALSLGDLAICLAVSTTPFWLVEAEKWLARRRVGPAQRRPTPS